jgi:hypothetical protein
MVVEEINIKTIYKRIDFILNHHVGFRGFGGYRRCQEAFPSTQPTRCIEDAQSHFQIFANPPA